MRRRGWSVRTVAMSSLRLDWVDAKAARFAVEHWHYSRAMPTPPMLRVGVWEGAAFVGVVIFSRGANDRLGAPYGLAVTEICELTRVALSRHETATSRIVAIALRMMRQRCPGLRLCVSYADPNQGHHGGIYQAGGWIYCGTTDADAKYRDPSGRIWHSRQVSKTGVKRQFGQRRRVPRFDQCEKIPLLGKHKYLMPLDNEMRAKLLPLSKPYPKRERSAVGGAAGVQPAGGSSNLTRSLEAVGD